MPPPEAKTANTSFASDESSIFSRRPSYNSSWQPWWPGTQETVPEDELIPHTQAVKESFMYPQPDKESSTDYGTSPETRLDSQADEGEGEGLSQDLSGMVFGDGTLLDSEKEFQDSLLDSEKVFQDNLRQVFCESSRSMNSHLR
jgi:hypothetical protein